MSTMVKAGARDSAEGTAPAAAAIWSRAAALLPVLLARQAETESNNQYSQETHQVFSEAGFYRILVPRKFGGLELGIEAHVRTVMAIARACPSTAWQLCFGSSHAVNTGLMFDEAAQGQIFSGDFICPMTIKPQGKIVQGPEGDWRLSGVFNYCSGIPYATHFMSHALPVYRDGSKGEPVTFLARRGDWQEIKDWGDTLGLKGSGSNSIRFENVLIPDRFVLRTMVARDESAIRDFGKRTRGASPTYYGRTLSWLILQPATIAVGAVKGALDEYSELANTKTTILPPIQLRRENPDFQRWFGHAIGRLSAAEAAILNTAQQWTERARQDMLGETPFSAGENARLALISAEAISMAWSVMEELLWRTAGTTPTKDGERMQRLFRDMSMIRSHAFNAGFDIFARDLAVEVFKNAGTGIWDRAPDSVPS
jgi:3-hydroxy-9,10-secoandrosta-1,3,5(10)-triene-9,17-dione monooxygenase